jgi:hypothetical protein
MYAIRAGASNCLRIAISRRALDPRDACVWPGDDAANPEMGVSFPRWRFDNAVSLPWSIARVIGSDYGSVAGGAVSERDKRTRQEDGRTWEPVLLIPGTRQDGTSLTTATRKEITVICVDHHGAVLHYDAPRVRSDDASQIVAAADSAARGRGARCTHAGDCDQRCDRNWSRTAGEKTRLAQELDCRTATRLRRAAHALDHRLAWVGRLERLLLPRDDFRGRG